MKTAWYALLHAASRCALLAFYLLRTVLPSAPAMVAREAKELEALAMPDNEKRNWIIWILVPIVVLLVILSA